MKKLLIALATLSLTACVPDTPPQSSTGVKQAKASIDVQASGMTVEQENIANRLKADNLPGSIKHLYVISAFSGDVILYSTVKGKVTSSGKRLTPYSVAMDAHYGSERWDGFVVNLSGAEKRTPEVLQDDGTYGSSVDYLYWWDSKGIYHQHYVSGGQIVHISSAPLRVGKVILNLENTQ